MEKGINRDSDERRLERVQSTLSSRYWRWTICSEESHAASVLDLLGAKLPHLAADTWEKRFAVGGVYYNGKMLLHNREISPPCKIEYYEPFFPLDDPSSFFPRFTSDNVVYEDGQILIVYKPAGIPAFQAKDQTVCNLRTQIEQYVGHPVHMPSRLDTSVGGLVIISTTPEMHQPLQRAFERREIDKTYLLQSDTAVTWEEKVVTARIDKDPLHPILRRCVASGGQTACTHFKKKKKNGSGPFLNLLAKPITGRTHQIRLHASHSGFPIIGDSFYHGTQNNSLHLLSLRIRFLHPFKNRLLDITAPESLLPPWAKVGQSI